MRLMLCALVILAAMSGPDVTPQSPTTAPVAQTAAPAIDFDRLHEQAHTALDRLRQSQNARLLTLARADSRVA